jgi:hypothetical protein
MEEDDSRVKTEHSCTQCGGTIFECTVRANDGSDHWYECGKCGCACPECKCPMGYQERDTSSGIEYRVYRCPGCGREGIVRQGIAMWKAYEELNEGPKP